MGKFESSDKLYMQRIILMHQLTNVFDNIFVINSFNKHNLKIIIIYITEKATEEEQKAKTSEEKFSKLKAMYTQIRDEHINLLRQVSSEKSVYLDIRF